MTFLDFYNLKQEPFGVTPDPDFLYFGDTHREALASLIYAIQSDRGFAALIAEPGMGKTSLLFFLLEKLRSAARTAFLFQTCCEPESFMQELLAELRPGCRETDPVLINEKLKECLLQESRAGRRVVVLIDEAQNLSDPVLESVRLLSDFETPRAKLIEIILSGQPELASKLARPELAQLSQRISTVCKLKRLPRNDVAAYIEHRLQVAGTLDPASVLTPEARAAIAELSEGVPRKINNLCFNALSLGCAVEIKPIGPEIVREAATDMALTSDQEPEHAERSVQCQSARVDAAPPRKLDRWFESVLARETVLEPEQKPEAARIEPPSASTATTTWADTTSSQASTALASETFSVFEFQRAWPHSVATTRLGGKEAVSNTIESRVSDGGLSVETEAEPCIAEEQVRPAYEQPTPAFLPEIQADAGAKPIFDTAEQAPPWPEPIRTDNAQSTDSNPPQTSRFRHGRAWLILAGIVLSGLAAAGMYLGYTKAAVPNSKSVQQQQSTNESGTALPHVTETAPSPEQQPAQARKTQSSPADAGQNKRDRAVELSSLRASDRNRSAITSHSLSATDVTVHFPTPQAIGQPSRTSGEGVASANVPPRMDLFAGRSSPDLRPPASPVPPLTAEKASVIPGKLIKVVQPRYPVSARSLGIQGSVVLDALVAEDGSVKSVQVLSGNSLLTGAAMQAVKQWRYKPYIVNGKPSSEHAKVRVIFSLGKKR